MLRSLFLCLAINFSWAAFSKADILNGSLGLQYSGTYTQAASGEELAVTKPLKTADILKLLNISNVDPATLRFYYDESTGAYVVAPKGSDEGTQVTPTATLLQLKDGEVTLEKAHSKALSAGPVTVLNGNVNGTYTASFSIAGRTETRIYTINAFGSLNGQPTIFHFSVKQHRKLLGPL